jgi:hypothetical protein
MGGHWRAVYAALLSLYIGVLVAAAWPQLLLPTALSGVQHSANQLLSQLGWPAGMAVFTGRGERDDATLRQCFRISGYTEEQQRHVLYDTMVACSTHERDVLKDAWTIHHSKTLGPALSHLRAKNTHRDRNAHPLNALFAMADHYCHRDGARYERLIFTSRRQTVQLTTGLIVDDLVVEGAHHCEAGLWETIVSRR